QIHLVVLLDGPQAADARAAHDARALRIGLGEIDAAVGDGLHAGGDAVVHEFVHAARFLGRDVLRDVKVADLAAEAGRESRHVETRDRADAALTAQHGIPRTGDRAPHRRDDPEACDDDAALAHALSVWRLGESLMLQDLARRSLM